MMLADGPVESMDFFSPLADGDDDVPDMPCFECSNAEDRPLAPAAEEYPLGCEVELRDVEFARMAQEESRWEPFLENVFAVPRRRVTVSRHLGDYTFVLCNDVDGYDLVGLTLYRACLSEPKVKTTKYYANIAAGECDEEIIPTVVPPEGSGSLANGEVALEDMFDKPIVPSPFVGVPPADSTGVPAAAMASSPVDAATSDRGSGRSKGHTTRSDDWARNPPWQTSITPVSDTSDKKQTGTQSPVPPRVEVPRVSNGGAEQVRRRNKFTSFMKRGTEELGNRNYESALACYNAALQEAPEEEARALSSRSVAYLLLKQTENALKDAKRVVELSPDSYLGYVRAGNVLRGMKQYNDAQSYYKEALKRDSSNVTIRRLLLSNSVAMLYDARTKRFPKFKMVYDEANLRCLASAATSVHKDDLVLRETTPLTRVLSSKYTHGVNGMTDCSLLCQHCGKPFVSESAMCSRIPGMTPEFFRTLFNESKPVRCNHDCPAMYCSDECRSKAWAFHHWVECSARGRWRDGLKAANEYLDAYIVKHTPRASAAGAAQQPKPASVGEDLSPMMVATCARVAIRMLSRMLSCVWALRDAVHMFDWLRVTQVVEGQRGAVNEVLQNTYDRLSENFFNDEKAKLTFALFRRCYERAKANSILVRTSVWGKIVFRADSLLAFGDSSDHVRSISPQTRDGTNVANSAPKHPTPASATVLTNEQQACLKYILAAPPEGIPGTNYCCLALFELYAATASANMSNRRAHMPSGPSTGRPASSKEHAAAVAAKQKQCPTPNLAIQTQLEPHLCIHVRATAAISKGETLVTAPPKLLDYNPL